jgi:phospholipid N-methyltransferase
LIADELQQIASVATRNHQSVQLVISAFPLRNFSQLQCRWHRLIR